MIIRKAKVEEYVQLREIFYSAIHINAKKYYTQTKLDVWASTTFSLDAWLERMQAIDPYLIEDKGEILGYADLQKDGYIDHFFIKGGNARRGLGSKLLGFLLAEARRNNYTSVYAHVSLAAESFFLANGFEVTERNIVTMGDQTLENARMEFRL